MRVSSCTGLRIVVRTLADEWTRQACRQRDDHRCVTLAHDISPERQLDGIRSNADRLLAFLLVLHFPAALGLAPLHGSWLAAIVVGGGLSGLALFVASTYPGT